MITLFPGEKALSAMRQADEARRRSDRKGRPPLRLPGMRRSHAHSLFARKWAEGRLNLGRGDRRPA